MFGWTKEAVPLFQAERLADGSTTLKTATGELRYTGAMASWVFYSCDEMQPDPEQHEDEHGRSFWMRQPPSPNAIEMRGILEDIEDSVNMELQERGWRGEQLSLKGWHKHFTITRSPTTRIGWRASIDDMDRSVSEIADELEPRLAKMGMQR